MATWKDTVIDFLIRYGFQLLGALIILACGVLVARYVGGMLGKWLTKKAVEPPLRMLAVRLVRLLIFAFTVIIALDKFGVQVAPMIAGIGVVGVGIGFAMQGVLSNVAAGLTIIFTKPFRVGEYIELLGVYGQVTNVELFSTTLTHADQSRIVIPNRKIVGEILHNYGTMRQLDLRVGVAYATDLDKAAAAIRRVLNANPRVMNQPGALIGVETLDDSAITISVQPWVAVADYVLAKAELYRAIVEEFRREDIAIPFPQQEIRVLESSGRLLAN